MILELEAFNKDNGKRLKYNKPLPLSLNVDQFVLPSVDSKKEVPVGNYKLIAAICIDGRRISKFKYYTLVLKKFQKYNTEKWVKYSADGCTVDVE